jgi:two-component system LytT family response regulator
MKLRVLIIDDEALARDRLRRLLTSDPEVEIVGDSEDGRTGVQQIRELRPDLILLDVQMPGMDGFAMLRALAPEELPAVVFVTAYDQHAVHAFEARALDYLLKPPSRARLAEAIARARQQLGPSRSPAVPQALLDLLAEREAAATRVRRIAVKNGERLIFVQAEQIDWVEAAGNYAILHVGKETHILRETMSALEAQLPPDAFLRVSRSAILNLRRVKELQSLSAGDHVAILTDGQRIGMTRSLREVEERLRFA